MRNEDYDRELLVFVTLVCAAVVAIVSLFETMTPSVANAVPAPTRVEQLEPVRVVGTPFVLNTNPKGR